MSSASSLPASLPLSSSDFASAVARTSSAGGSTVSVLGTKPLLETRALTSAPPPIALTVVAIPGNRNTLLTKLRELARACCLSHRPLGPSLGSAGPYLRELVEKPSSFECDPASRLARAGQPQLPFRLLDVALPEQQDAQMEAHRRRLREPARQRTEPRERPRRIALLVPADGVCHERVDVVRRHPQRFGEGLARGDRVAEALERDSVQDPSLEAVLMAQPFELRRRCAALDRVGEARHEHRQPRCALRMDQV